MKKFGECIKKCGDLRVPCGDLKCKVPAIYSLVREYVRGLAGTCGDFSYTPYARARAHTRARTCMRPTRFKTPQVPAMWVNSPNDNGLACGDLAFKVPAKTPQGPRKVLSRAMEAF